VRSTLRCAAPSSCCSVLSERHFPSTKNLETASRSSLAGGLPELNCVSGTSSRNSLLGNRFIFHHCSTREFLQWASSDFCQAFWDLPRYHPPFLFVIIVSPDSFQKANPAMVRFSVTEGGMTKRHSAGGRRLLFDSRLVCGGKKHTSASRRPIGLSSGKSRVLYCGWVLRLAISTTEVTERRNFQDSAMACQNKHPPQAGHWQHSVMLRQAQGLGQTAEKTAAHPRPVERLCATQGFTSQGRRKQAVRESGNQVDM
jgi:hypothetical protein